MENHTAEAEVIPLNTSAELLRALGFNTKSCVCVLTGYRRSSSQGCIPVKTAAMRSGTEGASYSHSLMWTEKASMGGAFVAE